jgi:hypothetical protein
VLVLSQSLRADDSPRSVPSPIGGPITWTDIPTVDQADPTLQRGIVYGPDGAPLGGANIYSASRLELVHRRELVEEPAVDLGEVRAVSDEQGRFEFRLPDQTWTPVPGQVMRWESLLVATKPGFAPGWLVIWDSDHVLPSPWRPQAIPNAKLRLSNPATLRGRFFGPEGAPVAAAHVRLKQVQWPQDLDLDKHLKQIRNMVLGDNGPGYRNRFQWPSLLPGVMVQTWTAADGTFSLEGLPQDRVADLEVTHPAMQTDLVTVAIREMPPVYVGQTRHWNLRTPWLSLYGSGFSHTLRAGVTLRGRVTMSAGWEDQPVQWATLTLANAGIHGRECRTDSGGRFEMTGLGQSFGGQAYEVAVNGSFSTPIESRRFAIFPDQDAEIHVNSAVPYRLQLADAEGQSIDRGVYSIEVQSLPGQTRWSASDESFNSAMRVAPGVYEGVVPRGRPGAVLVQRGSPRDRPVLVDAKAHFEPGRTDWTPEEQQYSYGNAWNLAQPETSASQGLWQGLRHSQLELAAVVFTKGAPQDGPLQLSAVVHQDDPPVVTLVDDAGEPVAGARLVRRLESYHEKHLPATFPLHGLHPERAEFIQFRHEERGLIGFLPAMLTADPIRVVMQPAATIKGRIATRDGQPTSDFGAIVSGAVPPDTMLSNPEFKRDKFDRLQFELQVVPGETYTGELVRLTGPGRDWRVRPTLGRAFGPVTPKAGETIDLGDIVVP